jgi:RNA polymerase sigma-70 factor, ECF subfamily
MSEVIPDSAETRRLLELVEAGDRRAFDRLFARHRPGLLRVVEARLDSRVRARLDASDVVQETQLEVYKRLPDYLSRRQMPFRLWLRRTAQEQLLLARRRHVQAGLRSVTREVLLPERSSLLLARPFLTAGSSPSQQLARRELVCRVSQAVALLSEADQEILLMRTYEGLSNQEAAYVLGLDPAVASKRQGRAVLRLHRLLVEGGLSESQL